MAQRIIRVYVDSSVFGGVHDIEFSRPRRLFFADALHVAVATVSGCSVIVSWNFKHIVNYRKIPLYNAINRTGRDTMIWRSTLPGR